MPQTLDAQSPVKTLKTRLLLSWDEVEELRPQWDTLLQRSRANSLFLTWEWIDAWRSVPGRRARPFVVAVHDQADRLVGIGPFYVARLRFLHLLRLRTLRTLGDRESGGEYPDWILDPDCEARAGLALARCMAEARGLWHCMWLPNVAGWTGASERISAACAQAGLLVRSRSSGFSIAALPGDFPSYLQSVSANLRSTLRRQQRRFFTGAEAAFLRCSSPADVPVFLEALFDLNHRRWSTAGQVGTFVRKPFERQFYTLFAPRAFARGWLRLYALKRGDSFVALQAGYVYEGTFLQLQEGFDPEAPAGVGNVLRARVIEDLLAEGIRTYDFLGEHTEHKRRWLAEERAGHDLLVWRRGLPEAVFALGVWPTGRYLRDGDPGEGAGP